MSFPVTCPACGAPVTVTDRGRDRRIRCANCEHTFVAPPAPAAQAVAGGMATSTSDFDPAGPTADARPPLRPAAAALGTLGRFQLREELGRGAFGRVYRAYDPVLDREVALKAPTFASDQTERMERFVREAKAAARLRHPNIVAVFETGRAGDVAFIVSEFVEGMPLSRRLAADPPGVRQAAQWVRDLALALAYAHGEGVVHRDVKPANIMIDRRGRAQLMDFGLAKFATPVPGPTSAEAPGSADDNALTRDGAVMGTPSYMSPEQARGEGSEVGPASDQYSLGAVLYEMLTGRPPFAGPARAVIARHADPEARPEKPSRLKPGVSAGLEAVVLKALAKDPARRYATLADLAVALQQWLNWAPIRDDVSGARPRQRERVGRGRRLRTPVVLAMLALCAWGASAGVAWWWLPIPVQPRETLPDDASAQRTLVGFSPDGQTLATMRFRDKLLFPVEVWDVAAGTLQARLVGSKEPEFRNWGYSPDGKRFWAFQAYAFRPNSVLTLWDVRTGKQVASKSDIKWDHEGFCLSFDGKTVAFEQETAPDQSQAMLWHVDEDRTQPLEGMNGVLGFSPDGNKVVAGVRQITGPLGNTGWIAATVFDAATGRRCADLEQFAVAPGGSCISPDGGSLAAWRHDVGEGIHDKEGEVGVWNLSTGKKLAAFPGAGASVFSPDSRLVLGSDRQGHDDVLWEAATGKRLLTPPNLMNVTFTGDGKRLIGRSENGRVNVWDVSDPGGRVSLEHSFSADGEVLQSPRMDRVVVVHITGAVVFYDSASGAELSRMSSGRFYNYVGSGAAFSPDGRWLATAIDGDNGHNGPNTTISIYDMPPHRPLGLILLGSVAPALVVLLIGWWFSRRYLSRP